MRLSCGLLGGIQRLGAPDRCHHGGQIGELLRLEREELITGLGGLKRAGRRLAGCHQLVHRRARAFDIADDTGLHLQRIFERADAGFPAIFCPRHKCPLRSGQVNILVLRGKLRLDLLHVIRHALGLGQKLLGLADLRLQRCQHGQRQGRQVLGLIDQRRRFVLERFDLVVDLLQRARGGQDVLRIVAGVVDDPAELGVGGCRDQHGCGHRQHGGTGCKRITETGNCHDNHSWLVVGD